MQKKIFKKNKVYIIAGKFKRTKISFNNIKNLRPTTNRIREKLFSWLSIYIKKAHCLDCFAGSGVLGIESISRDAASVTSLEIEKKSVNTIKKNIKKLNIDNLNIIQTNCLTWLKKNGKPYDIIFIDPPYYQGLIQKTIILLEKNKYLKKNSIVYIEKEKKQFLNIPKNWILYKNMITHRIECNLYIINTK